MHPPGLGTPPPPPFLQYPKYFIDHMVHIDVIDMVLGESLTLMSRNGFGALFRPIEVGKFENVGAILGRKIARIRK